MAGAGFYAVGVWVESMGRMITATVFADDEGHARSRVEIEGFKGHGLEDGERVEWASLLTSDRASNAAAKYPYAAKIDPAIKAEIAGALEASHRSWEEGRAASPSELDYVIIAREILTRRLVGFGGTTPEGEDFVADSLAEIQSGAADQQIVTWPEITEFIVDALVAE